MVHIISPHIDDAFLSLGGFILSQIKTEPIRLTYIFSTTDWTNPNSISEVKYDRNTRLVSDLRKREEKDIADKTGYDYDFLDFPDLPLRTAFTELQNQEMIHEIKEEIKNKIKPAEPVFFPLGIHHPDHEIIHQIGMELLHEGFTILLYEDQPYASSGEFRYDSFFNLMHENDFEAHYIKIDANAKAELLKCYASQVSHAWLRDIKNYSYNPKDNTFCERFWTSSALKFDLAAR